MIDKQEEIQHNYKKKSSYFQGRCGSGQRIVPERPQKPKKERMHMFCGNCGTKLPDDAVFCPSCGARAAGGTCPPPPESQTGSQSRQGAQTQDAYREPFHAQTTQQTQTQSQTAAPAAPPKTHHHFPFGTIVAAIILVAAVVVWIGNYQERAITDFKNIIFTQYNTGDSIGKTVIENMSHVEWSSEKLSKGKYNVILTGVDNKYNALIEATFRVTYADDTVYAVINGAAVNGVACDSTKLGLVMMLIYGQLDEDTLAGLVLWDLLW